MATSTLTTNTHTNRKAVGFARRATTVAAAVTACFALGACNTTPSATGSTGASSVTASGKSVAPSAAGESEIVVSSSAGQSAAGSTFGATKPVNAGHIELEESTDASGNKTVVPRLTSVSEKDSDGSGETQRVLRRRGEAPMKEDTGSWSSMYEFVEFVIQSNDEYWTQVFAENGLAEPMVNYIIPEPGVSYQTACSATDDNSMFYCPADDTIAFSQSIATRLWDGTYVGPDGQQVNGEIGDFAAALLVSHEVSHSIQQELGYNSTNVAIPMLEQHADCWAGVYTAYAENQGMLDAGDLREGVIGAYMVGDSHFDSPTHHGTPRDRIIAFATGYNGGTPTACNAYLPL
ncbi:MAG: neutral zinc metallopeptidase [Microthrixaceae bacterium]